MITTPVAEAGPARKLAVIGAVGDLISARVTRAPDGPGDRRTAAPRHARHGCCGGANGSPPQAGLGALLGGRHRGVAALSGLALLTASALLGSVSSRRARNPRADPRYTIEPQKRRLAARRAAGITDDSITTAG